MGTKIYIDTNGWEEKEKILRNCMIFNSLAWQDTKCYNVGSYMLNAPLHSSTLNKPNSLMYVNSGHNPISFAFSYFTTSLP
jgi:hypothetical protein